MFLSFRLDCHMATQYLLEANLTASQPLSRALFQWVDIDHHSTVHVLFLNLSHLTTESNCSSTSSTVERRESSVLELNHEQASFFPQSHTTDEIIILCKLVVKTRRVTQSRAQSILKHDNVCSTTLSISQKVTLLLKRGQKFQKNRSLNSKNELTCHCFEIIFLLIK